jgi:hypothetical protein
MLREPGVKLSAGWLRRSEPVVGAAHSGRVTARVFAMRACVVAHPRPIFTAMKPGKTIGSGSGVLRGHGCRMRPGHQQRFGCVGRNCRRLCAPSQVRTRVIAGSLSRSAAACASSAHRSRRRSPLRAIVMVTAVPVPLGNAVGLGCLRVFADQSLEDLRAADPRKGENDDGWPGSVARVGVDPCSGGDGARCSARRTRPGRPTGASGCRSVFGPDAPAARCAPTVPRTRPPAAHAVDCRGLRW